MRIFFIGFIIVSFCSCEIKESKQQAKPNLQWIDLTHSFDSTTLYWPNNTSPFIHDKDAEGMTEKGYYYSSYSICTPEHGGTHIDAPIHFAEGKHRVDEIPLSQLTGKAVLIDVSKQAIADRDYQISVESVLKWEEENGRIDDSCIVLFRTGYGEFYPDRLKYFGTEKRGQDALAELHFPGIDPRLAEWLVKEKKVKAVGLDTPSLDYGQSQDFKAHQVLMGANVPGFENLANLHLLPSRGLYVVALPMKIARGSGGPLRIIATVDAAWQ